MNYSNKLQVRFFIPIAEWLLSMGCDEAITEDCHNKQKLYESRYNINADNQETSKKALDSFNIPDDCKTIINLENLVKENISSINSKAFKGFVFYEGNDLFNVKSPELLPNPTIDLLRRSISEIKKTVDNVVICHPNKTDVSWSVPNEADYPCLLYTSDAADE